MWVTFIDVCEYFYNYYWHFHGAPIKRLLRRCVTLLRGLMITVKLICVTWSLIKIKTTEKYNNKKGNFIPNSPLLQPTKNFVRAFNYYNFISFYIALPLGSFVCYVTRAGIVTFQKCRQRPTTCVVFKAALLKLLNYLSPCREFTVRNWSAKTTSRSCAGAAYNVSNLWWQLLKTVINCK